MKIQLDLYPYTLGDPNVERELGRLLLNNLLELNSAIERTIHDRDLSVFQKAYHKCKPTVKLIGNEAFSDLVKDIDSVLTNESPSSDRSKQLRLEFAEWLSTITQVVEQSE